MRDFITSMRAGISFTDDKLLQWRLVAYDDAQVHHQPNRSYVCLPCAKKRCRKHHWSPCPAEVQNWAKLPLCGCDRPRCPLHNNAQDGPLNVANQTGEINYLSSEFSNQVSLHAAMGHCMQRSKDV